MFYFILTTFNLIVLGWALGPILKNQLIMLIGMNQFLNDWYLTIRIYFIYYFAFKWLLIKQWLNSSCIKLSNTKYLLTCVIENKEYKIIIEPESDSIIKILNDKNRDLTEKVASYIRGGNVVSFEPIMIAEDELNIHFKSGEMHNLKNVNEIKDSDL